MFVSQAQDIHFSQFYDSPLNLNPATTGDFDGSYRLVGNFRRQWTSVSSNPFRTTSFSADAHDFLKAKNFGLGLVLFQDIAGDSRLKDLRGRLASSYTLNFGKDLVHQIRLGGAAGINQFSLDYSDLNYGDQFNGNRFDPNLPSMETEGASDGGILINAAVGALYWFKSKKLRKFNLGISLANLNRAKKVFGPGDAARIPRRLTIHSQVVWPLKTNWYLEPFALFMQQGVYRQFNIGSTLRYDLDPRKFNYRAVFVGGSSRIGDAANLTAGLYYGPWKFGLSYDINYSRLTAASNYRGGAEIAVIYIVPALLPKRVKYKYCPDFL